MENISTNNNYPKTVVVRNSKNGMIWQIYHVKSERAAEIIAKQANENAFDGVTLEDYQPNMEETFPNWQNDMRSNVELRLLEGDNKITYLLNKGLITLDDIKDYTKKWMNGIDAYDDEQIDKYYSEEYGDNNIPDEYYGDWECSEGTLHAHDEECDCPNYKEECYPQEYIDEMNRRIDEEEKLYKHQSSNPLYVIASTSLKLEETMVFEADEHGNRISPDDYGCIAKRLGHIKMWDNRYVAVVHLLPDHVYEEIREIESIAGVRQSLYKRFDPDITPEELAASIAERRKHFKIC